jgi:hypothetical protein
MLARRLFLAARGNARFFCSSENSPPTTMTTPTPPDAAKAAAKKGGEMETGAQPLVVDAPSLVPAVEQAHPPLDSLPRDRLLAAKRASLQAHAAAGDSAAESQLADLSRGPARSKTQHWGEEEGVRDALLEDRAEEEEQAKKKDEGRKKEEEKE